MTTPELAKIAEAGIASAKVIGRDTDANAIDPVQAHRDLPLDSCNRRPDLFRNAQEHAHHFWIELTA